MKADQSRPWRKNQLLCGLLALLTALALSVAPAQAGTGGVGAGPEEGAGEGTASSDQGFAFGRMHMAGATWYGPGLYGRHTACGELLRPTTIGVAHRTLPCGTTVKLLYHGHVLLTTVIDRGPYTPGNSFDLTNGARRALHFSGADRLRYAVAARLGRH
jgi:rare lipoprotein A (RlpA)-like double-psi beta-barrel protein